MSELRDFVADLLEREGAASRGRSDPDGLEVLAPAPLQKPTGLARADAPRFRSGSAPAARSPIGLEGDWLDRFGALLDDEGRWSEREVQSGRCRSAAERPRTAARPRARPAERGLAFPGHDRDLDALPDAGVPLHRGVGREARGSDLARLQPRHRRGRQRHPGAAAAGAGASARLARARSGDQARGRAGMERGDARGAAASAARSAGAREHGAVSARHAPPARARPRTGSTAITTTCAVRRSSGLRRWPVRKEIGRRPTGGAKPCGSRRSSANTAPSSMICATTTPCASPSNGFRRWTSTCRCNASTC